MLRSLTLAIPNGEGEGASFRISFCARYIAGVDPAFRLQGRVGDTVLTLLTLQDFELVVRPYFDWRIELSVDLLTGGLDIRSESRSSGEYDLAWHHGGAGL